MTNDLLQMSLGKLQRVLALKKKIERLQSQLEKLVSGSSGATSAKVEAPRKRRKMSAAGRKAISQAAKVRWARWKAAKK